jgi:2-methylcitrate dehydratase PrpD
MPQTESAPSDQLHVQPRTMANGDLLAARLADWVVALRYDALPRRAVDVAKLLVLDQLGLQIRGATLPNTRPQRQLVEAMGAAPQSTVVLSGVRTVAPYAAFVNGTQACSCEYDDMHMFGSHIGSYVIPAALAFGECVPGKGQDVITAIVAGAQVMSLLGATTTLRMIRNGWHGAKVVGTFGATAAAGTLLGLTSAQLTNAFGIAGSDAAGTMEYEHSGGEVKRMHSGSAGRNGSQAALLAKDGLTGPPSIIDGERGLLRVFAGTDDVPTAEQWEHFHIVDTMFRMYPAIGSAAPALDAVRHLRREHELDWRDVVEIRLGLPAFAVTHGASVTRPSDTVSAQFSTGFSLALMLVHGATRLEDYTNPQLWRDPDLLSIIDRTVPYAAEFPPSWPPLSCQLSVTLSDGRVLSHAQPGFRGHPASPDTSDTDFEAKFADNVRGIISAAHAARMVELVKDLEHLSDITELMTLAGARREEARS